MPLEKMCIWVKGLAVDPKNDIIVSWNQGKMCFNHLAGTKAGKLIFTLKDLTSPENSITDVLINLDYRYFHTGTSTGQILVWKYDTSKKQIHSFQGHFKAVTCLIPVKTEPDLLLSAALDSTVRIWSLDKFQQLYMLHIPTDGLSYIRLYQGGQRVLMAEGSSVTTNAVHLILKNYLAVDAEIEEVQGGFDSVEDYRKHLVGFTISKCSDNSAFIQRVGEQHKCTLYPPPSS
jgi:WD40 repeat protein